jgi:sugar fermentation stimulation protein A
MKIAKLTRGRFVRRDNRFRATVVVNGAQVAAHVPNSGRLGELLASGRRVWLAPATSANRKTAYDLKLVEHADTLVSIDARLPNPLFQEALADGRLGWGRFCRIAREVRRGASRLDFRLSGPTGVCWVETKSVTLVKGGVALFPDAPTVRGHRHLLELIDAVMSGESAAVVFVIQRSDAVRLRPHREADPTFADALHRASEVGVMVRAYTCRVTIEEISIAREVPVLGVRPGAPSECVLCTDKVPLSAQGEAS